MLVIITKEINPVQSKRASSTLVEDSFCSTTISRFMSQRNPSVVTTRKPAIPSGCARFEWHCDNCGGDSIFDIEEWNMPSAKKAACLGCGRSLPLYLDAGVVRLYFRAQNVSDWGPRYTPRSFFRGPA